MSWFAGLVSQPESRTSRRVASQEALHRKLLARVGNEFTVNDLEKANAVDPRIYDGDQMASHVRAMVRKGILTKEWVVRGKASAFVFTKVPKKGLR